MQKILFILVLVILVFHLSGLVFNWYYVHRWMDIPMHMAGGLFIGLLCVYILEDKYKFLRFREHPWFAALAVVALVALIGIGWEWYEYFLQTFVQHKFVFGSQESGELFDTLKDLMDDVIGGVLAAAGTALSRKR